MQIEQDPFLDRMPDAPDLTPNRLLGRAERGRSIQAAYELGFNGAYTEEMGGLAAQGFRYHRDKFRRMSTRSNYRWAEDGIYRWKDRSARGNVDSEGYLATQDAFAAWERDKDPKVDDWLFQMLQNSGCCVGASWAEMLQGLLGSRAMDPNCGEVLKYIAGMWNYMFRGYCGAGWYGSASAARTREFGYAMSNFYDLPDLGQNFDFDGEQRTEDLTVRTWCRNQPDDFIQYVRDQGWFFGEDAIYEFSGGKEEIRALVKLKGQMHHGSNATGGSRPGTTKRIGGHQQTMFGARWDDASIKWLNDQVGSGTFSQDDFPCFNGQTWGPGACNDAKYWNESLWGPMPEGFFICTVSQQLRYFGSAYVYLPVMVGTPGDSPIPPPTPGRVWPEVQGSIYNDMGTPIRGVQTIVVTEETKPGEYPYLVEPKDGAFRLTPKYL